MQLTKGMWAALLVVILLTLAVYWQVSSHEFLSYDDDLYVTANQQVKNGITGSSIAWAFTSVEVYNWHPLTWLSHMMDVQLFGMNPAGHHLTSVGIHAAATILLFILLFRLTAAPWQSLSVAALFALHPLHVESVAWVAERKDVLSALFLFLTLIMYGAYVAERKPLQYVLALLSFILGIMSKPMLVTLPVLLLILDFWPLGRFNGSGARLKTIFLEKIPFFACSLMSAAVTIYAQRAGGAMKSLEEISFAHRAGNALISYVTYIIKTLWPTDLAIIYPFPASLPLWQVVSSLLLLLLVSVAVIRGGRRYPFLAAGWFWYVVTLVPVIGIVQVGGQAMADRYSYIPHVGLFIMVAWGAPELLAFSKQRQLVLSLLAGTAIIVFTALTWRQLGYWRDNVSLFSHAAAVTSDNVTAHNSLGAALTRRGDLDGAIREFREVIRIKPDFIHAYNNLGIVLVNKGDLNGALQVFQEVIRRQPDNQFARDSISNIAAERMRLNAGRQ